MVGVRRSQILLEFCGVLNYKVLFYGADVTSKGVHFSLQSVEDQGDLVESVPGLWGGVWAGVSICSVRRGAVVRSRWVL